MLVANAGARILDAGCNKLEAEKGRGTSEHGPKGNRSSWAQVAGGTAQEIRKQPRHQLLVSTVFRETNHAAPKIHSIFTLNSS